MRDAALVMLNLPLALVGGAAAVWHTGGELTIASLVGFITLFGNAARNGIMMLTHYRHMLLAENFSLHDAVIQGSLDLNLIVLPPLFARSASVMARHEAQTELM